MEKKTNPIHICSLSLSSLNKIKEQVEISNKSNNKNLKYKMLWINTALEYNRQSQLQNIFQHLGSKANHPKFRTIKMKPFWSSWKKEALRFKWAEFREKVDRKSVDQIINKKQTHFMSQRIELSARSFINSSKFKELPLNKLFNLNNSRSLHYFQVPSTNKPGNFNLGYNYLESEAIKTFSEFPESETEEGIVEPWEKPLINKNILDEEDIVSEQFADYSDDIIEKKDSPIKERKIPKLIKKEEINNNEEIKKEEIKESLITKPIEKTKNNLYYIIILISIIIILIFLIIFKKK